MTFNIFYVHSAEFKTSQRTFSEKSSELIKSKDYLKLFQPILDSRKAPDEKEKLYNELFAWLRRHRRLEIFDELNKQIILANKNNVNLQIIIASSYLSVNHSGSLQNNQFLRGKYIRGGKNINVSEQDRVRALQILEFLLPKAVEMTEDEAKYFYETFFSALTFNRWSHSGFWNLRKLTDLSKFPAYGRLSYASYSSSVPVINNKALFFQEPKDYSLAQSDGERLMFIYKNSCEFLNWQFANLIKDNYSIANLNNYGYLFAEIRKLVLSEKFRELAENETYVVINRQIKKIVLPESYNFIKLYKKLADWQHLGDIFLLRQKYSEAVKVYENAAEDNKKSVAYEAYKRIAGSWACFEMAKDFVIGEKCIVNFRYRNAKKVKFTVHKVDLTKLYKNFIKKCKNKPSNKSLKFLNFNNYCKEIIDGKSEDFYLGKIANWERSLSATKDYKDKNIPIDLKIDTSVSGGYLIEATLPNNYSCYLPLKISDLVAIIKNCDDGKRLFAFNPGNNKFYDSFNAEMIELKDIYKSGRKPFIKSTTTLLTTASGSIFIKKPLKSRFIFNIITPDNRTALIDSYFYSHYKSSRLHQKSFIVTDRPVYKPGDVVKFKVWFLENEYKNPKFQYGNALDIYIKNPQNETVSTQEFIAGRYGDAAGSFKIPENAMLGAYRIVVNNQNYSISFAVEEYRKPEYELLIKGPEKVVTPKSDIHFNITGKLYSGQPLSGGKLSYQVYRSNFIKNWFPYFRWGWLYGNDYFLHSNRSVKQLFQGTMVYPVIPAIMPQENELVKSGTAVLDREGKYILTVSTQKDFAAYNTDFVYRAEVTLEDESKRSVASQALVNVLKNPYSSVSWVDHGFYYAGDKVVLHTEVHNYNTGKFYGSGYVKILKLNNQGKFDLLDTLVVETSKDGVIQENIEVDEPGNYNFEITLKDQNGMETKSFAVVYVFPSDLKNSKGVFKFDDLKLFTDKLTYSPGDKAKIVVCSDNPRVKEVMLFVSSNSKMLKIKLKNGFANLVYEITKDDLPNFNVYAFVPDKGKIYEDSLNIAVPPVDRVIKVSIDPLRKKFKPRENVQLKIKLNDETGRPIRGTVAVAVYDRALDAIALRREMPMEKIFWGWLNSFDNRIWHNLNSRFYNLVKADEMQMPIISRWEHFERGYSPVFCDGAVAGGVRPMVKNRTLMKSKAESAMIISDAAVKQEKKIKKIHIRKDFADTAFWQGAVRTNKKGEAYLNFTAPENLTSWQVKAWAVSDKVQTGEGTAEFVTAKDFVVRPLLPRFLVEGDKCYIGAIIQDHSKKEKEAIVELQLAGDNLRFLEKSLKKKVLINKAGKAEVYYLVKAIKAGETKIIFKASTAVDSDAVALDLPVTVYGAEKMISYTGSIDKESESSIINLNIPAKIRKDSLRLTLNLSPSIAGAVIDAIPYLAEYSYGCTEQTLNRFVPAVVTVATLKKLNVDMSSLAERRNNLNPQQIGSVNSRREGLRKYYKCNPLYSVNELNLMIEKGLKRLKDMQLVSGGWGWFYGDKTKASIHLTAIIIEGLAKAKSAGVKIPDKMLQKAQQWLNNKLYLKIKELDENKRLPGSREIIALYALTESGYLAKEYKYIVDYILKDQAYETYNLYSKTLLGLSLLNLKRTVKLQAILNDLASYLVVDPENQTAYFEASQQQWWYWYNNNIEAMGYYLRLLCRTNPAQKELLYLVKYLVNNRHNSNYWSSTRDTAVCVESLCEYLQISKELVKKRFAKIYFDNQLLYEVIFDSDNFLTAQTSFNIATEKLSSGKHQLKIVCESDAPLYYNAYLQYFSKEKEIKKSGLELKVLRKYYKLIPVLKKKSSADKFNQVVETASFEYKRQEIKAGELVSRGDLIEVRIKIKSKNDYEYLIFEDYKPAGFEVVKPISGYRYFGDGLYGYCEFRFNRSCFFIQNLFHGDAEISYRIKADLDGVFQALPVQGYGMYAPELKANSNLFRFKTK